VAASSCGSIRPTFRHLVVVGRTLNALADNPYSSASEIILAVMYDHILGTLVAHFGFIALGVSANPAVLPTSLIFIRRFSFFLHQRLSQLRQPGDPGRSARHCFVGGE